MLDFRVIDISDRDRINGILKMSDYRGCEYSFANNMAWRRMYGTQISFFRDFYISCAIEDDMHFTFPAGTGSADDYRALFSEMRSTAEKNGYPFVLGSVTEKQFPLIKELFPDGSYDISTDEGGWDYVYSSADLIELKGKKYHGKRNHLKKMLESDHTYEPLSESCFDECIVYSTENFNSSPDYDTFSRVCEQFAINTYFSCFDELGLKGGVLRQNGRIVGFTIGEGLNSDTFCVHIEKADMDVQGAYPAINNYFAKAECGGYSYINREEDLGIEGLRKAKQSYHPAFMIKKYTLTFR